MRLSPLRHTVAILRITIGLGQQAFADLIGRAKPTLQSVELCKLPLSEKLAADISKATGIDPGWLLAGDTNAPLRSLDGGGPYGPEEFEKWQAEKQMGALLPSPTDDVTDLLIAREAQVCSEALADILHGAISTSNTQHAIAMHRIWEFLKQMAKDFGNAASGISGSSPSLEGHWAALLKDAPVVYHAVGRYPVQGEKKPIVVTKQGSEPARAAKKKCSE